MSEDAAFLYAAKRAQRRALQAKPIAEKLRILDELRERAEIIQGKRRTTEATPRDARYASSAAAPAPAPPARPGGRATASGVNYELRVAALLAAQMLAGSHATVWEGICGERLASIAMQTADAVNDVVVTLVVQPTTRIYISAKNISGTIKLTQRKGVFKDVIESFVRQWLALDAPARENCRLVWAVPSCVGRKLTHVLPSLLRAVRLSARETSLADVEKNRTAQEGKVLEPLLAVARSAWQETADVAPTNAELMEFLCHIYIEQYDFDGGIHSERVACDCLRQHVLSDPAHAEQASQILQQFFSQVNELGVCVTADVLRRELAKHGFELQAPPDYSADIATLQQLTQHNLKRLEPHATLRVGPDSYHVARAPALAALRRALQDGSLLLTGAPGCGKSGLLHALVAALQAEGTPVVLLLAEDLRQLGALAHALPDVLANWPGSAAGIVVLDAVDAVREPGDLSALHELLRQTLRAEIGWKVLASVREFDARHNRNLRELFAGTGVPGYTLPDLQGVAHLHLSGFTDEELGQVGQKYPALQPLLERARQDKRVAELYRSPFSLSLVCELLTYGAPAARLAELSSPALLLRRYWDERGCATHTKALQLICEAMVAQRSMSVSAKGISTEQEFLDAVAALRHTGILASPHLCYGALTGADDIRFAHHILHDYAIARALIPETPRELCEFVKKDRTLPILYRQSYLYALEELWDNPHGTRREGFWRAVIELEADDTVPAVTRIAGPALAARLATSCEDLAPLRECLRVSNKHDDAAARALRHLVMGLEDVPAEYADTRQRVWSAFARALSQILHDGNSVIQWPLAQLVALLMMQGAPDADMADALNTAGRAVLQVYLAGRNPARWHDTRLSAGVAAVSRTFAVAPRETREVLLALLAPERMAAFPHEDLRVLAEHVSNLPPEADDVVLRVFEAAFADEPERGEKVQRGTPILGLTFDRADLWTIARHILADYYVKRTPISPRFMAAAACIAWNSVERRHPGNASHKDKLLTRIRFRGLACDLVEDLSFISDRGSDPDENKILTRFIELVRDWSARQDATALAEALDTCAQYNRTALMWTELMRVGAEYPDTCGQLLLPLLHEPVILAHPDYREGSTALFAALHRVGAPEQRAALERLVLTLPQMLPAWNEEEHLPAPSPQAVQQRLLRALNRDQIVLEEAAALCEQLTGTGAGDVEPEFKVRLLHGEELQQQLRGPAQPRTPAQDERQRLCRELKPLAAPERLPASESIDANWSVILAADQAVRAHRETHPHDAQQLADYLTAACATIVSVATWPPDTDRWQIVRAILLQASNNARPGPDDGKEADESRSLSWSWPAPRLDAARALPELVARLGTLDDEVAATLRRLARDSSYLVRYHVALHLPHLAEHAPTLMWELADSLLCDERSLWVLDALARSLSGLLHRYPAEALPRLELLTQKACAHRTATHRLFTTLAETFLLRPVCSESRTARRYLTYLISKCDTLRCADALHGVIASCRPWLSASVNPRDETAIVTQPRVWQFLRRVLNATQLKRKKLQKLIDIEDADARESYHRLMLLADDLAMNIALANDTIQPHGTDDKSRLSHAQLAHLWATASQVLSMLANETHPHTLHSLISVLCLLLPADPQHVFLLAARAIAHGATSGFHYYAEAETVTLRLVQQALAAHREIFKRTNDKEMECMTALVNMLDVFVDAGWPAARRLAFTLEQINR